MAAPTLKTLAPHISRVSGKPIARTWDKAVADLAGATNSFYGPNPDRADGFNYHYYAKVRPDVVAAGVDLLRHWRNTGRFEGSLPYEGAANAIDWSDLTPGELARLPAPRLEMTDLYFPAGTRTVFGRARLADVGGRRPYRTFEARLSPVNADAGYPNGQGFGFFGDCRQSDTVFGAHNDWTIECEIDIMQDKPGAFGLYLSGGTSHPQIGDHGQAKVMIHVGIEPPAGYVHPQRVKPKPQAVPPTVKTWDYQTDFLGDISDWHRSQFDLNGASGLMCGPETTSKRGYKPLADTLPIIDGVRRMRVIDLGPNPETDDRAPHAGQEYRYVMPSLRKMLGDGLHYYLEIDFRYPQVQGLDPGIWYWDQFELDHLEIWPNTGRTHTVSFHTPDGIVPSYNPFGPADTRRTLCILRTADRYAQWQKLEGGERRLIVDGPNYAGSVALPLGFTLEGPGGTAAGAISPTVRYGEVMADLHALRFKQL